MSEASRRDYSLTGAESALAVERGLVEAEWFRPPIESQRLHALQQRNNHRAAVDTILWLALLMAFGYLAWMAWPSWWAVPAFAVYGALYGGAGDSRWHECGHGTAFRSKRLNDIVYYLASFMLLRQPTLWRWSHVRHHTDTIIVGRDPEIVFPRPTSPLGVIATFVPLSKVPQALWRTAKHAAGRIDTDAADFIPVDELGKLKWESRVYIAIIAGASAWSLLAWTPLPVLYIGLPTIYGAWLMVFFALTQHAGLREDVLDHRLNSRTVYMNPILRFLYSNMNYHVEHHIFPTVPYYALPALHDEVKKHLAPASRSTFAAYREIFSAMRKQWQDSSFDLPRPDVPSINGKVNKDDVVKNDDANGADVTSACANDGGGGVTSRHRIDTGVTVWAGDTHDGMVDLGAADMPMGTSRRIDRGDNTYALHRVNDSQEFYLTDGLCTHGRAHLAEGVLDGCVIECPKHNGCFDLSSGAPTRLPATASLTRYEVTVRNGRIVSDLEETR